VKTNNNYLSSHAWITSWRRVIHKISKEDNTVPEIFDAIQFHILAVSLNKPHINKKYNT